GGAFHAVPRRPLVNDAAAVVHAVSNDRPPVVAAGAHEVQFVAALRSVLDYPYLAGRGLDGEPLRIAVPVAPDLGARAGAVDERIVGRHAAVIVEPVDGALMIAQVLGRVLLSERRVRAAIADGDEQIALGVERQPRPEVLSGVAPRLGLEDLFDAGQA